MLIQHCKTFQGLEVVIVDDARTYFVNRIMRQLENVDDPEDILQEEQRQSGRLPDGGLEVLVRYCNDTGEFSVVLDESPSWLAELQRL